MATAVDASSFHQQERSINIGDQLLNISKKLTRRDLDSLLFLFYDYTSDCYEKHINAGIDLFTYVQRVFIFGDFVPRLAECLSLIDRNDLVFLLGIHPDDVRYDLQRNNCRLSPYRLFLFNVAESLNSVELKVLKQNCGDWLSSLQCERIISHHGLFNALEKAGQISAGDLRYLSSLLRVIERNDLAKKIIDAPAFQPPVPSSTVECSSGDKVQQPAEEPTEECRDQMDKQVEEFVERMKNIQLKNDVPVTYLRDMPSYAMHSDVSGVCVIINNEMFTEDSGLDNRLGSTLDAQNLTKSFQRLNFFVKRIDNMSTTDMYSFLRDEAMADHSSYDAFICCILTHGKPGAVHGADGKLVKIIDLTSLFAPSHSPSLTDKPKLFFLQACRGVGTQLGASVQTDGNSDNVPTIPEEADFLYGYATVFNYVSYRYVQQGSWYIYVLTTLLDRHADRHDLLSILTKVNEEVARGTAFTRYKQVPAPVSTLRKKVYFRTINTDEPQK